MVGEWIGDYRYLACFHQPHDDTLQHRFIHRGGKWAIVFKTALGVDDAGLARVLEASAPQAEAQYQADGGSGEMAYLVDGRQTFRLIFAGQGA